jgi:hypothetical protein
MQGAPVGFCLGRCVEQVKGGDKNAGHWSAGDRRQVCLWTLHVRSLRCECWTVKIGGNPFIEAKRMDGNRPIEAKSVSKSRPPAAGIIKSS